jgi:hypothetical protein
MCSWWIFSIRYERLEIEMAASLNDQAILAADLLFINRVRESLVATCVAVTTETTTTAYHYRRAQFATTVLNNPTAYQALFAYTVATDASVIGDATAAGTVALTVGNADTQQALVTDAHITNAVSGQFNSFFNVAS